MVQSSDEIHDPRPQINEILLKNSSFYREGPEDTALHLVDFVAIGSLAYQIIQYAANIFGATLPVIGGVTWAYKKFSAKHEPSTQPKTATDDQVSVPVLNAAELRQRLELLRRNAENETLRGEMISHVKQILEFHGWPSAEAEADAQSILTVLLTPEATGGGPAA
jgi:hypothetical protein